MSGNFFPTGDNITNQNFQKIRQEIKAGVAPVQQQINRVSSAVTNIAGAISNYYSSNSYVNNAWSNSSSYVNNYWNSTTVYMVSPLQQLQQPGLDELTAILTVLEKIYLLLSEAFDVEVTQEDVLAETGIDASLIRAALTRIKYVLEEAAA